MKIGIIGTGISGNAAAWLLHKDHEITVFEKAGYVGGHSNTVSVDGHPDIDTGFIVYNEWTYPNLIALFEHLGMETVKTDMSFAVSANHGKLEYSGDHIFAQITNAFKPHYYKMLADLLRFYKTAPGFLDNPNPELSLNDYLAQNKYSKTFIHCHILPMAAAIWSTGKDDVGEFPAASFIRFFVNHGLFHLKDRPQWWTVKGCSRQYVEKLTAGLKDRILTNTGVTAIHRDKDGVTVIDTNSTKHRFDQIIIATHSDEALALLDDASEQEKAVLGAFPYSTNTAYLHTDARLMPYRRKVWSSWNYMTTPEDGQVCVSYWMNKLQPFIGKEQDYFVTLNPPFEPAPEQTLKVIEYAHPMFTMSALDGWDKISTIQGTNRTWFCGAWCGYGFHEDGISAGLAVAESVSGLKRPWDVTDKSPAGLNCTPEKVKNAA